MDYSCVRHYILFYIHGPAILHLGKYHKIIKMAPNGHFEIVCCQKSIRSLADV